MRYRATIEGAEYEFDFEELRANSYSLRLGEQSFEIDLRHVGPCSFSVLIGNRSFDFDITLDGQEAIVTSRAGTYRVGMVDERRRAMRAAAGDGRHLGGRVELKAMMPGRVVNLLLEPGAEVAAEQGVLTVEAMKMENEIKAPKAGRVVEIRVAAGQTVEKGEVLAIIE